MFPIRNAKGLVIGFGARTMNGDEQPKYLNSPETPIYHKGSELYGYFEGREAIYGKGRAIVCEGYMDVIQLSGRVRGGRRRTRYVDHARACQEALQAHRQRLLLVRRRRRRPQGCASCA